MSKKYELVTTDTKICRGCAEECAISFFYANGRGGLRPRCKQCVNTQNREWRNSSLGQERIKSWKQANPYSRPTAKDLAYRKANPQKHWARTVLQRMIARGWLTRKSCETCSASGAEAHHSDYSRPLDVQWLCKSCHLNLHHLERLEAGQLKVKEKTS